jgi:hypothetical protein
VDVPFDGRHDAFMRALLVILSLLSSAVCSVSVYAQPAPCLPYEPEKIVLTGTVRRALAYGPPGFGDTPSRDAKEIFYSLELAAPICVLAGDDQDEPSERAIRQIQIAFINMPFDKTLPEQRVRVTGTLFHAVSGHHHTKVLISPVKIERLAS